MIQPAIEIMKLTKAYGSTKALDGLNLIVGLGEIYGLLGPNGSGKTTTIKIISAILKPDSGHIRVLGLDPVQDSILVKERIGYVPETPALYDSLTVRDFFEFVSSVRRLDQVQTNTKIEALAKAFSLEDYFDSPIASLSLGNKQKVSIISALLHDPQLLLLDEPLNGLDARSSRILKDIMHHQVEKGGTVVFSTHIMEVAEHICKRVGIIYNGKIVAEGSVRELRRYSDGQETLEEAFLKLTNEKETLEETMKLLRNTL
ncbi:MAG: ABC transporter ATP-binding protein [Conexivisphaerales archaeon]